MTVLHHSSTPVRCLRTEVAHVCALRSPCLSSLSPLIALMKDQVRSMTERGMTAVLVHESSGKMVGNVCMGAYRLVNQSPKDLLTSERWRDTLLCPVYTRSLAKT